MPGCADNLSADRRIQALLVQPLIDTVSFL
jgi:hypothetical protein